MISENPHYKDLQETMSYRRGVQVLIVRSWWVFAFLALTCAVYSHAVHKKRQTFLKLEQHLTGLYQQREQLLQEREELQRQVDSQSDPAWIQLTLMRGLGLVPEGQRKVYFSNELE